MTRSFDEIRYYPGFIGNRYWREWCRAVKAAGRKTFADGPHYDRLAKRTSALRKLTELYVREVPDGPVKKSRKSIKRLEKNMSKIRDLLDENAGIIESLIDTGVNSEYSDIPEHLNLKNFNTVLFRN